jgi:SAM-dependent methyltransferase
VNRQWQIGRGGTHSTFYKIYDALRRLVNRRLANFLLRHGAPNPGQYILEAGSGPAFASPFMASHRGVRLSGAIDFDLDALREARHRDPALPVAVADLSHLPFRPGVFDLAWNRSTLEHLDAPLEAL